MKILERSYIYIVARSFKEYGQHVLSWTFVNICVWRRCCSSITIAECLYHLCQAQIFISYWWSCLKSSSSLLSVGKRRFSVFRHGQYKLNSHVVSRRKIFTCIFILTNKGSIVPIYVVVSALNYYVILCLPISSIFSTRNMMSSRQKFKVCPFAFPFPCIQYWSLTISVYPH